MKQTILILTVLFCFLSMTWAADMSQHPGLLEAIQKYYDTVDKAKLPYENELRKVLANTQKAGNLQAYNAIEAELNHTIGKNGHNLTEFKPPNRSTMLAKKIDLKRNVDNARKEFQKYAQGLAADLLKDGWVESARDIDRIAKAVEPPRFYIEKSEPAKEDLNESDKNDYLQSVADRLSFLPEAKLKAKLHLTEGSIVEFGGFLPDGKKYLAVASWSKCADLFDLSTNKPILHMKAHHEVKDCVIFSDGKKAATGSKDGKIVYWSLENGAILKVQNAHKGSIERLSLSPDGMMLATSSTDKTAAVWEVQTGKEIHRMAEHSAVVYGVAFSPDGSMLATSGGDGKVILWNSKTGRPIHTLLGHSPKHGIEGLAFHPKGTILASGSYDNTIRLWDVRTGKQLGQPIPQDAGVVALDFDSTGICLAAGCDPPEKSTVWNLSSRLPLYRLPAKYERKSRSLSISFSPDGKSIATTGRNPTFIWQVSGTP